MATLKTITDFKSRLAGGGARSNLFEISIPKFPDLVPTWDDELFTFMCKGAPIPAANVSPVDIAFRGRILKVAGDRIYDPWNVTIINDENFQVRKAFEQWSNAINRLENGTGVTSPNSYMAPVAYVHQLGRAAEINASTNQTIAAGGTITPIRTYVIHNIWPTNISAIDLNWDSTDQIQNFTVDFQMTHWTVDDKTPTQVNTPIN